MRSRVVLGSVIAVIALFGVFVVAEVVPNPSPVSRVIAATPKPGSSALSRSQATSTPPTSTVEPSPGATSSAHRPLLRVLTIGDSIMKGLGLSPSEAWPALLASRDGWALTTLACNGAGFLAIGDPSDCGANFPAIAQSAPALKPDIILIAGSSNDLGLSNRALLASTIRAAVILKADFPKARIIGLSAVWGDTEVPDQLADINEQVAQAVAHVGGTYVDVGQPLHKKPELMQDDDVHPTAAGQMVLATAIEAALDSALDATADQR